MSYVKEIKLLADAALSALEDAKNSGKVQSIPVSEEYFLCRWIASAVKKQLFSNVVAAEMTQWVQQGRSMGKNANIKGRINHISTVYHHHFPEGDEHPAIIRTQFDSLIVTLKSSDWMVNTEHEINRKVRVISDGQYSIAVCSKALEACFSDAGELIKPLSLYVRGPELLFVDTVLAEGMLLTKVTDYKSIVKYHGEYKIWPYNRANCLIVLPESMKPSL